MSKKREIAEEYSSTLSFGSSNFGPSDFISFLLHMTRRDYGEVRVGFVGAPGMMGGRERRRTSGGAADTIGQRRMAGGGGRWGRRDKSG